MITESNEFYIFDEFDNTLAESFTQWVHSKSRLAPTNLTVFIQSPGGCVDSLMSMLNAMKSSTHAFTTIATGSIASAAFMFFISGDMRIVYDYTLCMSHQYSWAAFGKHHELEAKSKAFELTQKLFLHHYKKNSKLTKAKVKKLLLPAHDVYLTPAEMLEYGLADEILGDFRYE